MRACIVLPNMIVEERVKLDEELDAFYGMELSEINRDVKVTNHCNPIWASFRRY